MRLTGFLAFVLLSISILSYGFGDVAFATSDPNPALPISTDIDIATNGASVTVSGTVTGYDSTSQNAGAITYKVLSPAEAFAGIGQIIPNSDGSFEFSFKAGGILWKSNGDYTIDVKYGADSSKVSVNYVGGEQVITGQPEPPVVTEPEPVKCGPGTEPNANGICVVSQPQCPDGYTMEGGVCVENDGGCLIATAAYGTELAPQVQLLREIRDNTLFSTTSGTSFMMGFNTLYYSFAPTVADWERESPLFKEIVKITITPMLSTLSIMSLADEGSEVEVLGLGISVIALNLGMYIAAPALIGFKVNQIIKSRK